jgi:U3 small nucleolar RNA-associated protein 20
MDNDPSIQALSLECLLNWKDSYLTSHVVHLQNLISYSTLREELVTWTIGRETHQVQEEHRPGLIAVILRILYPKVMKRSGKFAGKVRQPSYCVLYLLASSCNPKNDCVLFSKLAVIS